MAVPGVSIETKIPFTFLSDGSIAMESDQNAQITQHVKSLVATDPGERVIIVDYGTGISSQVFEPDTPMVAARISNDIAEAMTVWEPNVSVAAVAPIPTPDGSGIADVEVRYARTDETSSVSLPSTLNRAILRPGGTVIEGVR
jgi:phage baseplate assembly protein W